MTLTTKDPPKMTERCADLPGGLSDSTRRIAVPAHPQQAKFPDGLVPAL